jgi:hypothetical protein
MVRRGMQGQNGKSQSAQTAARAVTDNSIANFCGSGQAVAKDVLGFRCSELEHKAWGNPLLSGRGHSEKFGTLAQYGQFGGQRLLSAQALATLGTTTGNNLTAGFGCHTRAKAMAAGANNLAGLKGTFHVSILLKSVLYKGVRVRSQTSCSEYLARSENAG